MLHLSFETHIRAFPYTVSGRFLMYRSTKGETIVFMKIRSLIKNDFTSIMGATWIRNANNNPTNLSTKNKEQRTLKKCPPKTF